MFIILLNIRFMWHRSGKEAAKIQVQQAAEAIAKLPLSAHDL